MERSPSSLGSQFGNCFEAYTYGGMGGGAKKMVARTTVAHTTIREKISRIRQEKNIKKRIGGW